MYRKVMRSVVGAAAAIALAGASLPAQAQESGSGLEEIVVTATRRETDLQSTPLSIQAFTSEQLELGGITGRWSTLTITADSGKDAIRH